MTTTVTPLAPPAQAHAAGPGARRPRIACVIPAYNEERAIARVVSGVPQLVDVVIVVDDASADRTSEVARALGDPRLHLVRHERNRGVGGAMVSGYRKALEVGADIVVKVDGDGQMDPAQMSRLLEPLRRGEADYAKGVRFRDATVLRRMPKLRLVGNLGLSFLVKVASGYWSTFDPTNGYTAIGRAALERIDLDKVSCDYYFESDMLARLYLAGAVVVDVPMQAIYGDETSRLRIGKVLATFPLRLLGALVRRIAWRYFLVDFNACSLFLLLGGALVLAGGSFGAYQWFVNAVIRGIPTTAGTVMLAALPVLLGIQILLQAVAFDIQAVPRTPLERGALVLPSPIGRP